MATHAGGVRAREVVVPVDVAAGTRNRRVRAGQRESGRRVIKGRARPVRRAVTLLASLGEARRHVIRIRRPLEVFQVATDTGRVGAGQVVVVIHVALHALHAGVCPGQRESSGRVIEGGAGPRRGAVALLAGLREARRHVVRIRGALEVFQVAAHARRVRTGQVVVAIHVALRALHAGVRTRQREARSGVVKIRTHPRSRAVALLAGLREA